MATAERLLKEALALSAVERVELIDGLLDSLDVPDKALDALWAREAESRIDAYESGGMKSLSVREALGKYRKK